MNEAFNFRSQRIFSKRILELAARCHLLDDVTSAHKLAVHIQLRVRRPAAVALQALAHVLHVLREDVHMREARAPRAVQRLDDAPREAAPRCVRHTLHEEHHLVSVNEAFNFRSQRVLSCCRRVCGRGCFVRFPESSLDSVCDPLDVCSVNFGDDGPPFVVQGCACRRLVIFRDDDERGYRSDVEEFARVRLFFRVRFEYE